MSTFEQTRNMQSQEHFTVIEIDVPVVDGVCTVDGVPGFGTPLSCDQPSNAMRTYKFTQVDAPYLPESGILRLITSISESPASLKDGQGLASRGTASISIVDEKGIDPNPFAPAVTQEVINQGTFLAKLNARNILANRELRIKNYRVEPDGTIDLVSGAQTRYYIVESFNYSKKGMWTIKCKDELSKVDISESVWPIPLEGALRSDVNDSSATWAVDATVNYLVGDTVRAGDELFKIASVSNIGTGSATITTSLRGAPITYTKFLSLTEVDSHDVDDEVFVCEVSDNEKIYNLLERILLDVGVNPSFIPKSDWIAEIDEWLPNARINTLWIESEDTSEILERILSNYMISMWFDPVDREIKISAISAWKESTAALTEGVEIDDDTVKKTKNEVLRATRAIITYNKPYLASPKSVENYRKASLFKRSELELSDFYGKPKTKLFDFSSILDKDSADLLVNRHVNRYINPSKYSWITQESKLSFRTGDVVDTNTLADIGFSGLPSESARMQIVSVKPSYTNMGREYKVDGLSYEPLLSTGSEIVISGNITDINLYIQYAGAPSEPVELTFIFDGAIGGSSSGVIPAIKAGAFPAGSKLILIMVNAADLQAKGGRGGAGADGKNGLPPPTSSPQNGEAGGVVYDAQGIDTDIYFSGATPSGNYPLADGYIRAPSGGAGGFDWNQVSPTGFVGGSGGDGGDGRIIGVGGSVGDNPSGLSVNGKNGAEDGSRTGWGNDGANNNAFGGSKGKGVVDNGATVNFFGDTAARYINGGGDH